MPHPHGQIYAFPYVPPLIERELAGAQEHFDTHQECLYCKLLEGELTDGRRIVAHNEDFVAFVPFAARFPAEIQIYARRHIGRLESLANAEKTNLARLLDVVRRKYDNLYATQMPLMMIGASAAHKRRAPVLSFPHRVLPDPAQCYEAKVFSRR